MRWEVAIPQDGAAGEAKTVAVDGDTWLSALSAGLTRSGIKTPPGESGFAVLIHDDGVDVSDFGLGRRIRLRYLDPRPKSSSDGVAAVVQPVATSAIGPTIPRAALPTVPHTLLFKRDEDRDQKNAVTYRERVFAVAPQTPKLEVEKLLRSTFEELAASIQDKPAGKFIHVTVFDHVFSGPPTRPALGALSWKDWRGSGPDITFPAAQAPLPSTPTPPPKAAQPAAIPETGAHPAAIPRTGAQPAVATPKPGKAPKVSKKPAPAPSPMVIPVTPAKGAPAPVPPLEEAMTSAPPLPGPKTLVDRPTPVPAAAAAVDAGRPTPEPERGERISWIPPATQQTARSRKPSAEVLLASSAEELLAEVFEAMQDLYTTRTREEAARFALTLIIQKVPCDAAALLLHDLATGELVYVAALGDGTESLTGVRTSREGGLIGAAIVAGEVLVVKEASDPRLDPDFDRLTGIKTQTAVCAPILHDGRVLGALQLVNRRGGKPFSDEETNVVAYILEKLAEHLVTALPELAID